MSYIDFTDGSSALAVRVGGVEVITDARALQNITTADFSGTVTATGAARLASGGAAAVLIGTTTANANNTRGLTIQQGAADNEALTLKSSDVAHGMTLFAETDSYGTFSKRAGTTGALLVRGYGEGKIAAELSGFGATDETAKSAAAEGYVQIQAGKANGTNVTTPGANANLAVIRQLNTTRFIFDSDGDAHADVSWTTF